MRISASGWRNRTQKVSQFCPIFLQKRKKVNFRKFDFCKGKVRKIEFLLDRWDSPLFYVNEDQKTPFEDIAQTLLFNKKKAKDPISTKKEFIKTGNYLYDLDKTLQKVLDEIIKQQNSYTEMNPGVDRIMMKMTFEEYGVTLLLKRVIPISDIKQFKKEFIEMNKMNPFADMKKAANAFIDFIQYYEEDF